MIRHILLDMGNVLLAFDPEQAVRDVLGDHPLIGRVADVTTRSPQWRALDQGSLREEEAIEAMVGRAPLLEREIRRFMEHWDECLKPVPGMEGLVGELKQLGYSLHLLSNAGVRFRRYCVRFPVFSLLDTIHISADMSLLKPDVRIYKRLLKELHLAPEDCLFLDDMPENIRGAQAAGLNALRFVSCQQLRRGLIQRGILPGGTHNQTE